MKIQNLFKIQPSFLDAGCSFCSGKPNNFILGKIISPRKRKSNKSLQLSAFEVAILNGNLEATKVFVENGLSETPFVKSKKGVSIKSSLLFPLHR